jgi:hypothetical protein
VIVDNSPGQPVGGTWTWSREGDGCVGTSDPLPYNASAEDSHEAMIQAEIRWRTARVGKKQ